ncbi:hypothetical protein [Hymenobacter fodinae]|uniref:Uncharacterized protein n=1 Tax=Hymenobacter fodinae TaxID=2510796 RepID=A0A4Z0P714_9BACT|nr:hypothetical protein [Hymenobacter fodinae]TGE07728.1 hypothetical protein EU556_08215 [Hymenobacter fodinae]
MNTAIKERPILFSGAMVCALLAGTKTQTRRTTGLDFINENPGCWQRQWIPAKDGKHWLFTCGDDRVQVRCPYGVEGERLWVRETFAKVPRTAYACSTGVEQTINPASDWEAAVYRAGWTRCQEHWKPSIHMPRWASRIQLEIVSVRVERLRSISAEDAIAEGIEQRFGGWINYKNPANHLSKPEYEVCGEIMPASVLSYATLWESINGEDSWEANPWVWVVEFKRVEP